MNDEAPKQPRLPFRLFPSSLAGFNLVVAFLYQQFTAYALRRQYPGFDRAIPDINLHPIPGNYWNNLADAWCGWCLLLCLLFTLWGSIRNIGGWRVAFIVTGIVSMLWIVFSDFFGVMLEERTVDP